MKSNRIKFSYLIVFLNLYFAFGVNENVFSEINSYSHVDEAVDAVLKKNSDVKSYSSNMAFTDFNQLAKLTESLTLIWDFDFVAPDKYSVTQSMSNNEGDFYNRWITIKDKAYVNFGKWMEDEDDQGPRKAINDFISFKKWMDILPTLRNKIMSNYQENGQDYLSIEGEVDDISPFLLLGKMKDKNLKITSKNMIYYLIDWKTMRVITANLDIKGKDQNNNDINQNFIQYFVNYDSDIQIEKPNEIVAIDYFENLEPGACPEGARCRGAKK